MSAAKAPRPGASNGSPIITEEDLEQLDTSEGHAEGASADEPVNQVVFYLGAAVAIMATLTIVALVTSSVVLRYFFNSSLPIASEGPTYFFPWLIAGGAIIAQSRRGHIAVDVLVSRLYGRAHDRAQVAIWVTVTVLLGYLTYLAVYLIPPMAAQTTPIMGWPQLGSFGAFILMAACLTVQAAGRTVHYIRHGAPHVSEGYDASQSLPKETPGV